LLSGIIIKSHAAPAPSFVSSAPARAQVVATPQFEKDVLPVLAARCLKCHGAAMQLSRLDLRTRETALKGGDHGPAIVPGNSGESRLFRLVSGGEKPAMPMDGTKLNGEQIAAIKNWIEQGAPWSSHWAFTPPRRTRTSPR
jgi:mono/diheme cytochrome c family protein